jgi:SRSO17 transposase
LLRRDERHQPISAKALALNLATEAWQTITWREGAADWLSSRFARQRVRPAHRDTELSEPRAEEWLLIEWPQGEAEPTKYWLATRPGRSALRVWSMSPSCDGGSSATTRSSSRNSASAIMKGAGAFTKIG